MNKPSTLAWILYDFANSAYTTLVVTFVFATYFVKTLAPDPVTGTALWSRGITVTALAVALLSPVLGALADRGGRQRYLTAATLLSAGLTGLLYFIPETELTAVLICFILSNIAFELANVFYNAFLPDLAPKTRMGTLSGLGWGLGYIGGLAAMFIAMAGFISPETPWFGLTRDGGQNIRATNLLVAAWFVLFSLPLLFRAGRIRPRKPESRPISPVQALGEIRATAGQIKAYKDICWLLIARLFYNDGLITIFAFGGIYAAGTFHFTFKEIMIFGIVLNICAGAGALVMGIADDRMGGKKTIQLSNIVLSLAVVMAMLAPDRTWFWAAGILIGLFAGPNQSASRSLLGRFVPAGKENQFFGFFAMSGKLTAFMGPFFLGLLTHFFNSQRAGVGIVVLFFILGGILLTRVDEKRGIQAGQKKESH